MNGVTITLEEIGRMIKNAVKEEFAQHHGEDPKPKQPQQLEISTAPDKRMNLTQAAIYMGLSENKVRKLVKDERIPFERPGRCFHFFRKAIDPILEDLKAEILREAK